MQSKQIEDIVEFAVVTISTVPLQPQKRISIKIGLIGNIQNFVRDCTTSIVIGEEIFEYATLLRGCLLYTSPSPRDSR